MSESKFFSKHEFKLRWVDLDAYNHLNNAKYYDFMTECRAETLFEFKNECNFVVIENSCKYRQPFSYPENITVEQHIQNISSTSFEFVYLFKKSGSETVVSEGFAKMVCFDAIKNRPCKIPEKLKALISNL